jgi:hypothetical protein
VAVVGCDIEGALSRVVAPIIQIDHGSILVADACLLEADSVRIGRAGARGSLEINSIEESSIAVEVNSIEIGPLGTLTGCPTGVVRTTSFAAQPGSRIVGPVSIIADVVADSGVIRVQCPGGSSSATAAATADATLTIDGDLELSSTARLELSYFGLAEGEFDILHVTGLTTIDGTLEVHFREGFEPEDPDQFVVQAPFVVSDGGRVGDFSQRIYAFPDRFADFDDDADKDLVDVAAFMNCVAQSGAIRAECERADWENDGVIGGREIQELGDRLSGSGAIGAAEQVPGVREW